MPSLFEPCGLAQQVALKYGTVPIVRKCGGLADTVADCDYAPEPPEQRTGYVFQHPDHQGLESAMGRAIKHWNAQPHEFRHLMLNGMRTDCSWARPGPGVPQHLPVDQAPLNTSDQSGLAAAGSGDRHRWLQGGWGTRSARAAG